MAETVGTLVDKLSILQLKIYYFNEQLSRKDVDVYHKKDTRRKIKVLKVQKKDLEVELYSLLKNLVSGETKLKIYRQFKMYNDPQYRLKNG